MIRFICAIIVLIAISSLAESAAVETVDSIELLREGPTTSKAIYVLGYSEAGDGGEGMLLRSSSPCQDDGVLHYTTKDGICYARAEANGLINVRWAGARGDGKHDDTDALERAHALLQSIVANGGNARLSYPAGSYNVHRTIPLPSQGSGWELIGEGMPTLVQASEDMPIFRLLVPPKGSSHKWKIEGLSFRFSGDQSFEHKNAVAISLGSTGDTGDGIYDFEVDRVMFINGWRGISVDRDSYQRGFICPIWGWYIKNVTSYTGMQGATIWFDTLRAGSPRGSLVNFYSQNKNSVEPAVSIKGMAQFVGSNLEFNLGSNTSLYLQNRENSIDSLRFEAVTVANGQGALATFGGGQVYIRNLEVQYFNNKTPGETFFLSSFGASLTLENLWTFGSRSSPAAAGWRVARVQNGGDFKFKGSWRRTDDGAIKMNQD